MNRRDFLGGTMMQAAMLTAERAGAASLWPHAAPVALKPMAFGPIISPANAPEEAIQKVHALGMSNCFLSLDGYDLLAHGEQYKLTIDMKQFS